MKSHLEDTKVTRPSVLPVPHKDRKGVEIVEQQAPRGNGAVFSTVYRHCFSLFYEHTCAVGGCPHGLSSTGLPHLAGDYLLVRIEAGIR